MSWGLYITHPEVVIDPNVPVGQWSLSETGLQRTRAFSRKNLLPSAIPIFSSVEKKALDLAEILSAVTGSLISKNSDMVENDRSSTGFLEPAEFENHVTQLFAHPERSVAGWETALHAQKRIVATVEKVLANQDTRIPVVFTGHGCVGTLLKCHLAGREISQREDQRERANHGGGNVFAFDLAEKKLLCDWTAMENWSGFKI